MFGRSRFTDVVIKRADSCQQTVRSDSAAGFFSQLPDRMRMLVCSRSAKRELTEHAAQLAVGVAEQRIRRSITPDDQVRLVDRYASQLKEAR